MNISELKEKELPKIPPEIQEKISESKIALTSFENKNDILRNRALWEEAGFKRFPDGSYLVSMYCPMPKLTEEMIRWWFWWHPQANERYRVWFPGAHFKIGYPKRCADYFEQSKLPPFQNNTQFPTEKIGGIRMPLRIDFMSPEEFGFSREAMEKNDIPLIVCGRVGAFDGLVWHTEMAHIFHRTEDGLFLISRFWLGKTINPILRKLIINDSMALGMTEHCAVEYRNLAEILPALYKEYCKHG